ncbi:MAG: response regulator transcription factor [Lentisphaerae bacterium]|nr:response regulator transcription factor [Lentisphaerota bacterium]
MDKIVLIEDDPGIRTVIRLALKGAGFTSICEAGNGTDGLALVQREKPALVILDLMLPGMDGLGVCSAIRRIPSVSGTPIVMLTARTAEEDVVRGLELGADDYITKPFSKAILVARVKAALRRTAPPKGPLRTLGPFVLDETTRTASIDGVALGLTRSEFDLLDILSAHPGRVYTRQQIISRIQREEKDVTD